MALIVMLCNNVILESVELLKGLSGQYYGYGYCLFLVCWVQIVAKEGLAFGFSSIQKYVAYESV